MASTGCKHRWKEFGDDGYGIAWCQWCGVLREEYAPGKFIYHRPKKAPRGSQPTDGIEGERQT
jgi:hypothetical protein